jgi:hypothetical protein
MKKTSRFDAAYWYAAARVQYGDTDDQIREVVWHKVRVSISTKTLREIRIALNKNT